MHLRERIPATVWRQSCVNVSSFPSLSHGYGNFDSALVEFCACFWANEECCLSHSGDIEICSTVYTGESILTLLTHICSDVGLMFSHDGRTEHWGTDGSNCLINLELLNISVHKVEETKQAVCSGSEMPAAVRVANPYFTLHLSICVAALTKTPLPLHSEEASTLKLK